MRRRVLIGLAACAGLAIVGVSWHRGAAQNGDPLAAKAVSPEHPLPIRQVVLFNSGVGYLQREGVVAGDAKVDLSFAASDINDLLKSLVLQDLGGGKIATVSYDSYDPLEKILHSFAIDLNNNPTFGQILNQARGERIEVQLMNSDKGIPAKISGLIVGTENKQSGTKDGHPVVKEMINLLASENLQSIPLDQIVGVRFVNPVLEQEFQRALKVLASTHDMAKKAVSIHFSGQGQRAVRVGYVVERPIWKTTYRLRCDPNGKIFLQGWALVENTSDDDWNDVRMVLVSGRPISFRMNLYEPLYIPRPLVEPELFSSLRPVTYGGNLQGLIGNAIGGGGFGGGAIGGGGMPVPPGEAAKADQLMRQQFGQNNAIQNGFLNNGFNNAQGQNPGNRAQPMEQQRISFEELQQRKKALDEAKREGRDKGAAIAMNFKEGIQSVASAEEVGDYFQYVVDRRISLSRQKSAMLPIIDHTIEGSKVSIYNESVHGKHPLLGLRIKNTSGQPLTQGPVTVYDDSTYAGDTRILDVQPNESRLLSYALDQGTEVKSAVKSTPSPEMTFKIGQSSMSATYKQRETRTYTIKNRSAHDRVVIVEHPIRTGWKLVDPTKPVEQTRNLYRFDVPVKAGEMVSLAVVEDEPRVDQVALRGGQPEYVAGTGISIKDVVTAHEETLQGVKVVKGLLTSTMKARETHTRYVQNLSDTDREFHIDHIVRADWTLLMGKQDPIKGPAVHRMTLKIAKGKAEEQAVTEERIYRDKGRLVRELPETKVRELMENPVVSDAVKKGLAKHLELSFAASQASKIYADLEKQLKAASDDQNRLRQNLNVIPQSAEPYKKFLDKFVTQETAIEELQRQLRLAEVAVAASQREHEAFLIAWTAE